MQIQDLSKFTEMAQIDLGKLKRNYLKTNKGRLYLKVDEDYMEADSALRDIVDLEDLFEDTEVFDLAYDQLARVEDLEEEIEDNPKEKIKLDPEIKKGLEEFNKNISKAPLNIDTVFEARFENINIALLIEAYKKINGDSKLKSNVKLHLTLSLGSLSSYQKGKRLVH